MDKSLLKGLAIGVAIAVGGVAAASFGAFKREPSHADVLEVTPVTEVVRTPKEECRDETVTRQKPVKDEKQVAGTLLGAVAGGVLGSNVGSGSGRDVATVAGAVAGGYAGNKAQEEIQERNTYTTTERQCRTVTEQSERTVGYDVRYRLNDQEATVRMDFDPGDRIPVRNGELVLTNPAKEAATG